MSKLVTFLLLSLPPQFFFSIRLLISAFFYPPFTIRIFSSASAIRRYPVRVLQTPPQTDSVAARVKKNLIELKVIFLEIVYLELYSDKVWGFSIFSFCTPPGDIYRRLLLSSLGNFYSFSIDIIVLLFLVGSCSFCMYTLCTYYYYYFYFILFLFL